MTDHRARCGPQDPGATCVGHAFPELLADPGEVQMNHATAGDPKSPALLLVPGRTESWWGSEAAMPRLAERFEVFAVDLRGQGRSTRTPGRLEGMTFEPEPPQTLEECDPKWGGALRTGSDRPFPPEAVAALAARPSDP